MTAGMEMVVGMGYSVTVSDETRNYYKEALEIFIEYSDRHSQASTYINLGNVVLELEEFSEAKANYLQALQTFVDSKDKYHLDMVLSNLVPVQAASICGVTEEELKAMINNQP